jgi:hypothetical protein
MKAGFAALLLILISFLSGAEATQRSSTVRLLRAGTFLIQPPKIVADEQWFGVFGSGSSWNLLPVKVASEPAQPTCGSRAARISTNRSEQPLFLVSGIPGLAAGLIPTAVGERQVLYPGQFVGANVGRSGGYIAEALGTAVHEPGGAVLLEYALWIRQGPKEQRLVSEQRAGLDNPPEVVWIGDIDRDSRPDVLLNVPTGDVGARYLLFVSSMAETNGELVAQAATFAYPGC